MDLLTILDSSIQTNLTNLILNSNQLDLDVCTFDINGNFRFIKNLGKGAFGEVTLVEQDECLYAEKTIMTNSTHYSRLAKFELRSLKLVNEMCPDGVVKYYDHLIEPDRVKIYTEYLDGPTLVDYSEQVEVVDADFLRQLTISILKTLKCLHDHRISHGDIKLANVILIGNRAILIDFGGTCVDFNKKFPCRYNGTPNYFSPEIWDSSRTERYFNTRSKIPSDIWALGILLYYLIYKEFPYKANTRDMLEYRVKNRRVIVDYHDELMSEIIELMLTIDVKDRPTVDQLLQKFNY